MSTPDQKITLRRATDMDAAALKAVIKAAYARYDDRDLSLPAVEDGLRDIIAETPVFVAEDSGGILGGLVLRFNPDNAQIENVAVSPLAGGRGIGKALLAHAEGEAKSAGFSELVLATHFALPENIALYAHLGWQETGREGVKVYMSKPL